MKSALKKVSLILAICFVAFHLYTAAFGTMPGIAQKSIHLARRRTTRMRRSSTAR